MIQQNTLVFVFVKRQFTFKHRWKSEFFLCSTDENQSFLYVDIRCVQNKHHFCHQPQKMSICVNFKNDFLKTSAFFDTPSYRDAASKKLQIFVAAWEKLVFWLFELGLQMDGIRSFQNTPYMLNLKKFWLRYQIFIVKLGSYSSLFKSLNSTPSFN